MLYRRLLALLFSLLVSLCAQYPALIRDRAASAPTAFSPITDEDFLHVEGAGLVSARGEQVILKGVNIGGWLIQETWMCPVEGQDNSWAHMDTLKALEARFSPEEVRELFDTYMDNWFTEYDLDAIASSGCNSIRVPFWYRNFMTDEYGAWITENPDDNPGFQRLDWVIREAGERGLYVILDMHGAPGAQSLNHSTGHIGGNMLYYDGRCQEAMKALWSAIAERYQKNPVVAAYDIMNEPQNNNDIHKDDERYTSPWVQEAWDMYNDIYRKIVPVIRAADPEHIITLEGIWRVENLPDPKAEGWTNMMYQMHLYDPLFMFRVLGNSLADYCKKNGVAAYIGEFRTTEAIPYCNRNGISWSTWTYKGASAGIEGWTWIYKDLEKVDPSTDSFSEIKRKWGELLRSETFERNWTQYVRIRRGTRL
ncbi:MAG: glycoside hydrolase family 5 protein [Oscillospiraceae bacterium]|jgi:hypothetical protein|nr:glycoside hydrolase family 5 protein [Oscillospiraceae bacterium]